MTRGIPIRSLLAAALLVGAAACGDTEQPDSVGAEPIATTTQPATTVPETTVPETTAPETTAPETTRPATVPTTVDEEEPMPAPTAPQGEWPESVAEAVAALADDDGRDPADIVVVRYERVTWRDGSLGCPDPDMAYTQALVPGYRIELELDGVTVWYHGSADGAPFRCDDPSTPAEAGNPDA